MGSRATLLDDVVEKPEAVGRITTLATRMMIAVTVSVKNGGIVNIVN